ncbi:MAG: hypothetical protein RL885_25160 [Planctomycetota bacterium]
MHGRELTFSKKLTAFFSVVSLLILDRWLGLDLGEDTRREIVAVAVAYLIGQGVADFGKGRTRETNA